MGSHPTIARDPKCVDGLLEKIRSLAPLVERHRDALDRERRLPKPIFDAVVDADLLRLWVPKGLGGPELSPLDFMQVVEAVSELDASIGWIVGNGAGMPATCQSVFRGLGLLTRAHLSPARLVPSAPLFQ